MNFNCSVEFPLYDKGLFFRQDTDIHRILLWRIIPLTFSWKQDPNLKCHRFFSNLESGFL